MLDSSFRQTYFFAVKAALLLNLKITVDKVLHVSFAAQPDEFYMRILTIFEKLGVCSSVCMKRLDGPQNH